MRLLTIFCLLVSCLSIARSESEDQLITRLLGYHQLTRITDEKEDMLAAVSKLCADPKIFYGPHVKPGILLYVNDLVLNKARQNSPKYPIGSIWVKEKYEKQTDKDPSIITVMEKTSNTGAVDDWKFYMIRIQDRSLIKTGFRKSCASCHSDYDQTDFITNKSTALLETWANKNDR